MGFYDDLKKPVEKKNKWPEPPPPRERVFSDDQRLEIAKALCSSVKRCCSDEKKNKKHRYHGYCSWCICYDSDRTPPQYLTASSGDKPPRRPSPPKEGYKGYFEHMYGQQYIDELRYGAWNYHTQYERDQILPLLRRELIAEGFPADCVRAYDYTYDTVGHLMFKRGGHTTYTIEVDVRW